MRESAGSLLHAPAGTRAAEVVRAVVFPEDESPTVPGEDYRE
jgi:hypothetical protein